MITVSTPHGPASFKADSWEIDEHQLDILTSDDRHVASYAPGAWLSVERENDNDNDNDGAAAAAEEPRIRVVDVNVHVVVQGPHAAELAEELRREIGKLANRYGALR